MPTNEYMKEWRKTPAGRDALNNQNSRDKARRRAWKRLQARYSEEFEKLFAEELAAEQ